MKFGSLINLLLDNETHLPKVGDHVTLLAWTDRKPATVVFVCPLGSSFQVRDDKATPAPLPLGQEHLYGANDWVIEEDPAGHLTTFKKATRGKKKGQWSGPCGIAFNRWEKYVEPSF